MFSVYIMNSLQNETIFVAVAQINAQDRSYLLLFSPTRANVIEYEDQLLQIIDQEELQPNEEVTFPFDMPELVMDILFLNREYIISADKDEAKEQLSLDIVAAAEIADDNDDEDE